MQRGMIGTIPRAPRLADESYLEFTTEVRTYFRHGVFPAIAELIDEVVPDTEQGLDDVRKQTDKVPLVKEWKRYMRTHQEMIWRRGREALDLQRSELLREMEEAELSAPNRLTLDPDLELPDYLRHEIHLQPGGYAGDDLAGVRYLFGTKVFYLGRNDQDELHAEIAKTTAIPEDGVVSSVLDIGCGIGQATVLLKQRFPEARVLGIDAAAPMLRYAHLRAVQQRCDVYFEQRLAEATNLPDRSQDMVLSYIMFHEMPLKITRAVVAEVFRLLRPGGKFSIFDFPTAQAKLPVSARFLIENDHHNNCEPFSVEFIESDFRAILEKAGFAVTAGPSNMNGFLQTLSATKPSDG